MLSENEIEKIEDLRDKGFSVSQISKKISVDRGTVRKYFMNEEENDEVEHSSYPPSESPNDTNSPHRRREIRGRRRVREATPKAISFPPLESLRSEFEGAKVEFEIEKLEEAKSKWEERRDKERKEKVDEERGRQFDETALRMSEERNEERQIEARRIIQKVKYHVLSPSSKAFIPTHILGHIYSEIEKCLTRMDVLSVPFDELVILAEGILSRIIRELSEEIRPAMQGFLAEQCKVLSNRTAREEYQKYRNRGGRLSFKNFIFSVIRNMPEEDQINILRLVDFE